MLRYRYDGSESVEFESLERAYESTPTNVD